MFEDSTQREASTNRVSRRGFLATATAAAVGLAGCLGSDGTESGPNDDGDSTDGGEPPTASTSQIEDPPDAVYLPSHRSPVTMLDPIQAGEYMLLPHHTLQHQFWLMRGNDDEPEQTDPRGRGLHFMFAVWDAETGKMLPVDIGLGMTIRREGQQIDRRQPWPMISQEMGFHFGDNIQFPESGGYDVEVDLNPIDTRKTGAFSDRFEEGATAEFRFEYDTDLVITAADEVEYLDEKRWGEPGALEPMGHGDGMGGMAPGVGLPAAESYPGTDLGVPRSGEADFVVRQLGSSRLADGDDYLFVSPRTPYNRVPLPDMSLSVEGDVEGSLTQTLDSELGHHYGLTADLAGGDTFDIVVETPPQVARHQGYETTFIDMPPVTVEVS
ncbi:twin-arginine translocation signal domain-containing protein [Halobacteriaceae archaeon SHR40]|uniref:twin-arginine translocation signal domain-containing protein n=1 Tax=Halovenus amylolytica TaxID=2500550 RepID=UPI000FE2CBDA